MSEALPESFRPLSELVETVDEKVTTKKDGTKPYIGLENIPSRGANLLGWEPATSSISTNSVFLAGDILFGKLRPNLRKSILAPFDGYCSTDLLVLRAKEGVNHEFISKVFQTEHVASAAEKTAIGTKMPRTSWMHLRDLEVFCPDPDEQELIAGVLNTLDTSIRETEVIIAKLKAIKQGLLHDLLTRGIGADGELRPPQSEAPHLYKDSPLGWIPKEWEVKQVGELLANFNPAMRSGPFGSALLKGELVEAGIPLLGIDNVFTEYFVDSYQRFVTPRKFAELARYAVRPADLMITIMGTVGRCCLVPDNIGLALSSKHTWAITLDQEKYSPYLAMLQINFSPWVISHFEKDQQGGTMAAIRSETLRSVRLPIPPREEQWEMERRLRAITSRIEAESEASVKMQAERLGLMDDLLTGRVRVTPLLAAESP